MRNLLMNPEDGPWKQTVMPYEMSDPQYKNPLIFNKNVESLSHDFRRVTFERMLDTDWGGARREGAPVEDATGGSLQACI